MREQLAPSVYTNTWERTADVPRKNTSAWKQFYGLSSAEHHTRAPIVLVLQPKSTRSQLTCWVAPAGWLAHFITTVYATSNAGAPIQLFCSAQFIDFDTTNEPQHEICRSSNCRKSHTRRMLSLSMRTKCMDVLFFLLAFWRSTWERMIRKSLWTLWVPYPLVTVLPVLRGSAVCCPLSDYAYRLTDWLTVHRLIRLLSLVQLRVHIFVYPICLTAQLNNVCLDL